MNRRDALKALASVAGTAGLTITPVSTQDAKDCALILLKVKGYLTVDTQQQIREIWLAAVQSTALEQTKVLVMDERIEVEFLRMH